MLIFAYKIDMVFPHADKRQSEHEDKAEAWLSANSIGVQGQAASVISQFVSSLLV